MNIADVCSKLAEIEDALSVTVDGNVHNIKRAYQFMPDSGNIETPCFMHGFNLTGIDLFNSYRQQKYTVRAQCLVAPISSGSAMWSRVAAAFHMAFIDAMAYNVRLKDMFTVQLAQRGAGEATLTPLEWNEIGYVGLDYQLDVLVDGAIVATA